MPAQVTFGVEATTDATNFCSPFIIHNLEVLNIPQIFFILAFFDHVSNQRPISMNLSYAKTRGHHLNLILKSLEYLVCIHPGKL
ncbi:hypothetical protein OIU77_027864 [Salix suchowensis]|uniref:Uncharacterized protein n=1 Tax=Salix suchowensis TaxID=1278906 RepID=A0ABQ9BR56_9ROSI|nr:hypothetical protein OIU77_027864 [Salix suchowensis]